MSIVMDSPRVWGRRHGPSCHLLSTLPGAAGSAELAAFALRIGLRPAWLQKRGGPQEHYDLFGGRIAAARLAGAIAVPNRVLALAIAAKRQAGAAREAA